MKEFIKKWEKTVLFAIYAGIAIGLGGLLNIVSNHFLNPPDIGGRIVGSLLFPVGLTLVCVIGLNLFTGKIGFVFDNNKSYLPFLAFVYFGNIIGSLIMGGFCHVVFKDGEVFQTALKISEGKMFSFSFLPAIKVFAGSVLCGVLVYTAILSYNKFNKKVYKLLGIFVSIGLFVFLKFDHCIANMFYFSFSWSWTNPLSYLNIAVVTLGNSAGAIFLNEGIKSFKKMSKKNG